MPLSSPDPDSATDDGLGEQVRNELAIALHHRWHGDRSETEPGKALTEADRIECARLSGAFDDVASIEPIIIRLLNDGRTP